MRCVPSFRQVGLLIGMVFVIASTARGQVASETLSYFPLLGQGNTGINYVNPNLGATYGPFSVAIGPNACVPTATAIGLSYLENYLNVTDDTDPFTTSPNSYAQVNAVATAMGTYNTTKSGAGGWTNVGGTLVPSIYNGLQNYLANGGANPAPSVTISGQYSPYLTGSTYMQTSVTNATAGTFQPGMSLANVTPTATFLANALNANDGVEIGIVWGSFSGTTFTPIGGAHELALDAINLSGSSGTISFIDPWGNATSPGSSGYSVVSTSLSVVNGFLYVTYPLAWVGDGDPNNNPNPFEAFGANNGQSGIIVTDMVEAVPEPATVGLMGFVAMGLLIRRSRHPFDPSLTRFGKLRRVA